MRSCEEPVHGFCEADHAANDAGGGVALNPRYVDLTQQHHDLDYLITALSGLVAYDELLVARLKKRKLQIKDEIARVAAAGH